MRASPAILAGAALLVAAPALAVGFGPLRKEGITSGPAKAFYLTLLNPYTESATFRAYAVGTDDENPVGHIRVLPQTMRLGPGQSRRVIAIADHLDVGTTRHFRVCAERADEPEGTTIHARVCSHLGARRVTLPAG